VHLVGELFEGVIAVPGGVALDELGQCLDERGVGVIQALELEEIFEQGAPFALGGANREEDEDGVVAGACDLDAAGVEELGEDRTGTAPWALTPGVRMVTLAGSSMQ